MQYHHNSYFHRQYDVYWFEKNLQGDIVAVYDEDGTKLISYTYDAWGNFTTTYHNGCTASDPANFNPYRYRSYYYDAELEMYYLQSRYYDPAIGRFINADATEYLGADGTLPSFNLFAYCGNNPVMGYDPTGTINWGNILKAALVVVAVTVTVAAVVATAGAVAVAAGVATTATVAAATTGAVVGGLVAGASEIAWQCSTKGSDNLDYGAIAIETFVGSAHGAIDGVAATSASVARRTACKVGKIVLSGVGSTLHCANQDMDARETIGTVTKSMAGAAAIQACMLGADLVQGMLNTSILESYMLDGKLSYGIGNMLCTAGLRALSNGYRNIKGIIKRVF